MVAAAGGRPTEGCDFNQGPRLAHVGQAKPAADQPAAWKNVLDLFGRGAGGHVEVLGNFTQQQISNAAAHDKSLEARFLQFADDFACVRAKVF